MAQSGIFDQFNDTMMSPLFLGGAALMTGEGMGGAVQGMQAGNQFAMQRQKQAEQQQRRQAFDQMMQGGQFGGVPPEMMKFAQAAGPDAGIDMLAKAYQTQQGYGQQERMARLQHDLAMKQQANDPFGLQRAHADLYTAQAAAARQKASGAGGQFENPKQRADVEEGLRKEYAGLAKPYFEVRDAYTRIEQAAKAPSAAGDMALIFNFMKMLDPGSVVREGEFATAQNAAGVPERIRAAWNRTVNGERLTPDTRADFTTQARGLFERQEQQYRAIQDQYRGIASRVGVDPANTILDFSRTTQSDPPKQTGGGRQTLRAKNAQGQVIESDDGVNWRPVR